MTPLPARSQRPHQDALSLLQARKISDWSGVSQEEEFSSLQITFRTGIASFCLQCPFFHQRSEWSAQSRHFPYLEGWGGDWGKSFPHSRLFCCYLGPHNPCRVRFTTILHLSPPMHLDLSPPYLSDSQMGLDCLIRESRHRVISSYLGSNCTRAAARPEICAPLIALRPLSRSFSLPALDSRKGRGKFSLKGSVICWLCLYVSTYIFKTQLNPVQSTSEERFSREGRAETLVPCCLRGQRTFQHPESAKKMHPDGNNQAKQNHPKSTEQRLLQGRCRLGKSGWAVSVSLCPYR